MTFYILPHSAVCDVLVRYPCDQCGYQATHKAHLNTHTKSKHQGIKFQCDQCEYQATQKCHLNTHIKNKHNHS